MRLTASLIVAWILTCLAFCAMEKDSVYLTEKMLPLVSRFVQQHNIKLAGTLTTNDVTQFDVDKFENRPGAASFLFVNGRYVFSLREIQGKMEVHFFSDKAARMYDNLSKLPKSEFETLRAQTNVMTKATALRVATEFFHRQGHRDENFLPVEVNRISWVDDDDPKQNFLMPYYEAKWLRRDVNLKERDEGYARIPEVHLVISATTSNLVYYSKVFMPVGSDF